MSLDFSINSETTDVFVVFKLKGYFGAEGGAQLISLVEEQLCKSKNTIVIDFSNCTVLCSPGVGCIIDISVKVVQESSGKLYITGVDQLKEKVLTLTGVTNLAKIVKKLDEIIINT
ncbi:MAG: STAS domain-containing protein [Candidatus Riflebacteria bacterium]|nr:STAS domain-containing protein [Candidatus Riflebacteria bacterium]